MTPAEALHTYLAVHPIAARHLNLLIRWDENKTVKENNAVLKFGCLMSANNFRNMYKLGSRLDYKIKVRSSQESIQKLIDSGLTKAEVARLLCVSAERIRQILEEGRGKYDKSRSNNQR